MKRLSTALAPALLTGALIASGGAIQAQTNLYNLESSATNSNLVRGSSFTLTVLATQGNAEAKTTTVQPSLRYDPAYFNVSWTPLISIPDLDNDPFTSELTVQANNRKATATIVGGAYAGLQTVNMSTYGLVSYQNGYTLAPNTAIGRWNVTLLADAPGGLSEIGFLSAVVTGNTSPIATNRATIFTTNPPTASPVPSFLGSNYDKPGAYRIGVVPGPSSLAVFALGGLAPAMALLRRRRAAK